MTIEHGILHLISVEIPLEQLALNVTNDPNPVRYDGNPPVFEPEGIKVASIGSLAGILSQAVVANTTPTKVYYYLNDHLGTPQLMTDENNVVVWEAKYKPFGEAVVHPYSTVENNIRFPGQYFDQETGLHYNYHRYYDPRTGRYLRADPSHFVQTQGSSIPYLAPYLLKAPEKLSIFSYVDNNPINAIDPLGLYRDIGGGFGVTAGIISVSISVHTDACCDEQGRKHIRTIQTVCAGWELGLGLKGGHGASGSVSDDQTLKKCPKMFDESGWYSEDSGVWGALVVGRSYSITRRIGTWKVGFGGGWTIYSGCRNDIINDVIAGKCCS